MSTSAARPAPMPTVFGSLADPRSGGVQVIDDSAKSYVFSNVFETAANSAPYERVCAARNFEYVVEAVRAEGESPWYTARHDEFALCMDGEIEIELAKPGGPAAPAPPEADGAHLLGGPPEGPKMGRIVFRRGHQALLPAGAAYRFRAASPGVMIIQTIQGPLTVEKWADICRTD